MLVFTRINDYTIEKSKLVSGIISTS